MKEFLRRLWKEEEGAETAEWIVVVSLIVGVAVLIYTGVLKTALTNAVTYISDKIGEAATAPQ